MAAHTIIVEVRSCYRWQGTDRNNGWLDYYQNCLIRVTVKQVELAQLLAKTALVQGTGQNHCRVRPAAVHLSNLPIHTPHPVPRITAKVFLLIDEPLKTTQG